LEELSKITNVTPVQLEVTSNEDIVAAKRIIEKDAAGLLGLINNAGITKVGPLMDVSTENLRA
jgi:NAD(P)-dependent dehydrogenase (short-subunit alcohol dehydrogenase family)